MQRLQLRPLVLALGLVVALLELAPAGHNQRTVRMILHTGHLVPHFNICYLSPGTHFCPHIR